jgi:hypothetical protein
MSAILALLMAAAAPVAPTANPTFDIRCMLAAQIAHEQVESEMKAATLLSVMFFFGRVDARLAPGDLEQRLEEEAAALNGQPLGPLLQQCGKFMEGRGAALQAIGARLEAKDKAGQIG